MNKKPILAPMAILMIIFGLVLQINFQACSPIGVSHRPKGNLSDSTKSDELGLDSIGGMVGNGNGTGYGGKPRDFYSVDPDVECTPSDSSEVTNIDGILRVKGDQNIKYYEGCEIKGSGSSVDIAEVTFSSVNPDVVLYRGHASGIFSYHETKPVVVTNYDWAVCHFYPMPMSMMGVDYYFSVIQATIKYDSPSDSYRLGVRYEKISPQSQGRQAIVEKGFVPLTPAAKDVDSNRFQYRPDSEHEVKRLDVRRPEMGMSPEGRLYWMVDGYLREFVDGICKHRDY